MHDYTLIVGLVLAVIVWGLMFGLPRKGFWGRTLVGGVVTGTYGVVAQHAHWSVLFRARAADAVLGVVSALLLYGVFYGGDRVVRVVFPSLSDQVGSLYSLRGESGARYAAWILVVVGSCEELFWRGFVQQRTGLLVALVGYAVVLLWERNAILFIAALVGGAWWGLLFELTNRSVLAPVISHLLWDLLIVVWFPVRPAPDPAPAT